MTADRVERARHAIRALASDAPESAEYREGVLRALGDVVPWEGAIMTPFDPATTVPTAGTGIGVDLSDCHAALELEYHHVDVDPWTAVARSGTGVGVRSRSVDGDLDRSVRYRELYRGSGWHDELRAAFRLDGTCWGCVTLLRSRRAHFSAAEAKALGALGGTVAEGLRMLFRRGVADVAVDVPADGPAVVTFGADGEIEGLTPAARDLLACVGEWDTGVRAAMQAVLVRQQARADGAARVRLRTRDGGWLVLRAGALRSRDGAERAVVTIEPARPPEVVAVVAASIGLTARETEVLEHLLAGRSSVGIGRQLFLSPHRSTTTSATSTTRPACGPGESSSPGCSSASTPPGWAEPARARLRLDGGRRAGFSGWLRLGAGAPRTAGSDVRKQQVALTAHARATC